MVVLGIKKSAVAFKSKNILSPCHSGSGPANNVFVLFFLGGGGSV